MAKILEPITSIWLALAFSLIVQNDDIIRSTGDVQRVSTFLVVDDST